MSRCRFIWAILAVLVAHACTGVELEQSLREDSCPVVVRRTWPSGTADTSSLCATALLARVLGEVHYRQTPWDTVKIGRGEYVCTAIAAENQSWDLSDTTLFVSDLSLSLRDVKAGMKVMQMKDLNAYLGRDESRGELKDMAENMPLYAQAGALMLASVHTATLQSASPQTIDMHMKQAVASVVVNVRLSAAPAVEVEEVIGCLTGVPGTVFLMYSEVDPASAGKLYFNMEPKSNGYSARLALPGLLNSPSYAHLTGNGIMHICITANCLNDEGRLVRRHFILSRNIKDMLEAVPVLVPSGHEGRYTLCTTTAVYNIPGDIRIDRQNILDGDMGSMLGWKDESGTSVEGSDDKPVIM